MVAALTGSSLPTANLLGARRRETPSSVLFGPGPRKPENQQHGDNFHGCEEQVAEVSASAGYDEQNGQHNRDGIGQPVRFTVQHAGEEDHGNRDLQEHRKDQQEPLSDLKSGLTPHNPF